ncbi:MAG: M23 family metallopeptidase [Candidatus Margulisbacteria bacterium]|nr:M23 family metallopeptidase [Candidatus Margulisiibacteriota bacterium]MBU1021685.1 M23 family metallopeptidase [Candidatus Margulisiibacteriota bacterium]MBU1729563.1 M23 family metallopeptidase [Candidatus Margulisiibacteriota bacterium]MBU1955049.1 M23 family metallopeptidase [Candidatus Margulisiibacteriota bacterium]
MKRIATLLFLVILASAVAAEVDLNVSYPAISRGRTLTVKLITDEKISEVKGEFLSKPLYLYDVNDGYRAYIPIPLTASPGYYPLSISYQDADGNDQEITKQIKIKPGVFRLASFSVPVTKTKLMKRPKVMDDWVHIEKVLVKENPHQLWEGTFIYPLKNYYITLPFGARETVNGQKRGQHRGVDFGSELKEKTDIFAVNSGEVVLARWLDVFGGTVVIDHGQGVHSLYYHLSKVFVEPEQIVEKGAIIGKMGTTGASNGIHLHLGLSVHNVRVEPLQWLKGQI